MNEFGNRIDMLRDMLAMDMGSEETKELMRKTIIESELSETRAKRKRVIKKLLKEDEQ